jgi:Tfp pilus assembly protein PilV
LHADHGEGITRIEIAMTIVAAVIIAIGMVLLASMIGAQLRHARERHTVALASHRVVAPWRRRRPF